MTLGIFSILTVITVSLLIFLICHKQSGRSRTKHRSPPYIGLDQEQTDKLIAFLEEADDAYIKAYQYRTLGGLLQYTTRDLAIEMQQKITYYNDKIWASPAHRQRTWTIVSTEGRIITVRKELTFKKVKYGRMLVKIGDDCVEYWKVVFDNLDNLDKHYKIQEIIC